MNEDTPLIPASKTNSIPKSNVRKGRWQMFLLLMVCAAPVIASYVTFYLIKPTGGQTNYGELVFPVEPVPAAFLLPKVQGKWTLLMARPAQNCETDEENCLKQLFSIILYIFIYYIVFIYRIFIIFIASLVVVLLLAK